MITFTFIAQYVVAGYTIVFAPDAYVGQQEPVAAYYSEEKQQVFACSQYTQDGINAAICDISTEDDKEIVILLPVKTTTQ